MFRDEHAYMFRQPLQHVAPKNQFPGYLAQCILNILLQLLDVLCKVLNNLGHSLDLQSDV